ncbi:MAG: hypothetical protein ACFB10_15635 [Salibacteraceae bacterium]
MRFYFSGFLFALIVASTASCSLIEDQEEQRPVARVFDRFLYPSDLLEVIPEGTLGEDSTLLASNYIQSWIRQTLLVYRAEQNLGDSEKDVQKQIEDYRNSLLIYAFERELVRQKLDTNVSAEEIQSYYENNQGNFELKDYIVKVFYVKLEKNTPELDNYREWMVSKDPEDRAKLEDYCRQFAVNFYLDDENWLYFDDLTKEVPVKEFNIEKFLKNSNLVELEDDLHLYLLNVKDYRLKDSTSPLSLERDRIRNIILNQRKVSLINEMKETIYQDAVGNNHFEIYK